MLTPRQQEILNLIVRLYGQLEEPIGSKTLLKESYLSVSPATIRNEMVVLERLGYIVKAHTSSGRIPSKDGYKFYISQLLEGPEKDLALVDEALDLQSFIHGSNYSPLKLAQLGADLMVSITGFTAVVLGQDKEAHYFDAFKLVPLTGTRYIGVLITDKGATQSTSLNLGVRLEKTDLKRVVTMVNEELEGVLLEDAFQRTKIMLPLLTQRLVGYQLDFSPVIEEAMHQIRGHRYYISGKTNIFDLIDGHTSKEALKHLLQLLDGSKVMYDLLEHQPDGMSITFGYEFLAQSVDNITLVTGSYTHGQQKITLGLLGPSTMAYEKVIGLLAGMIERLQLQ